MPLPRLINFCLFCLLVVGCLVVENAWNHYRVTTHTRITYHTASLVLMVSAMAIEAVFDRYGLWWKRKDPTRPGGFPVEMQQRKDDET